MQVVECSVVPMDELTLILGALNALKRGDTAVRLPLEWSARKESSANAER